MKKLTFDTLKIWRGSWGEGSREKLTEIWDAYSGPKGEPEAVARLALAYCAVNKLDPTGVWLESTRPGYGSTVAEHVEKGNGRTTTMKPVRIPVE
ncbi:MAG TPA: hypothetical protein DCY27_04255 [Desulfobacterales bacterium]|jgi:hypothetical protein|nr:hypothetical protein [Desulfobacterales bacterium]